MSAKQVSSGYILWKTDPEPVRHSHSGERRLLTITPALEWSNPAQTGSFIGLGYTPSSAVWGEQTSSASARSKETPGE